ncbi:MAG: putative sugar transporter permease protein [Acidimicrobiales bacterium]|nr:putative sugar transporter permease protein [Acidimicrobiales bacterium]
MSLIDTAQPLDGPAALGAPAPGARGPLAWLARIPRPLRLAAYLVVGVALLTMARLYTGAGQLTAQGTFQSALELALPIALAGLGGLWAERAGVVNIGLEGMMALGTWFGAYGAIAYGPWTGVLLGVLGGAVGGLLHALATVTFGVDHIISGVAINLLGVGVTEFLTSVSWNGLSAKESPTIPATITKVDLTPFLNGPLRDLSRQRRPVLSDLANLWLAVTANVSLLVVLAIALFPLSWYLLWRTPMGLRLRAVGEDPEAADSLGVKVYRMKYLAVTVSGALSGLGGVLLVYLFSGKFQSGQTGGRGFIGLAAMIFGNWRPGGLIAGAGLFGFMDSMQSQVDETSHALLIVVSLVFVGCAAWTLHRRRWISVGIFLALAAGCWWWYEQTEELPRELIPYFPHITTLLVLVFASQRLRMPAADGRVYRRSGR